MDISLDKIDTVVARTNVSFTEAKEALERAQGDVIEAIILIEEDQDSLTEDIGHKGEELIDKVKELIREGNVTKVIVKKDGKVILNLPVTFAAAGAILAIKPALIGLGIAVLARCSIEIVKEDGQVINVNELVEDELKSAKESISEETQDSEDKDT